MSETQCSNRDLRVKRHTVERRIAVSPGQVQSYRLLRLTLLPLSLSDIPILNRLRLICQAADRWMPCRFRHPHTAIELVSSQVLAECLPLHAYTRDKSGQPASAGARQAAQGGGYLDFPGPKLGAYLLPSLRV